MMGLQVFMTYTSTAIQYFRGKMSARTCILMTKDLAPGMLVEIKTFPGPMGIVVYILRPQETDLLWTIGIIWSDDGMGFLENASTWEDHKWRAMID